MRERMMFHDIGVSNDCSCSNYLTIAHQGHDCCAATGKDPGRKAGLASQAAPST
jgi:hypothetical protein